MWENTQNTYKIGIPSPTHTLLNFWLLFLLDQLLKSQYFHLVVWRNMRPLVLNFWLWLDFLFVLACIKVISYFLYTTYIQQYLDTMYVCWRFTSTVSVYTLWKAHQQVWVGEPLFELRLSCPRLMTAWDFVSLSLTHNHRRFYISLLFLHQPSMIPDDIVLTRQVIASVCCFYLVGGWSKVLEWKEVMLLSN